MIRPIALAVAASALPLMLGACSSSESTTAPTATTTASTESPSAVASALGSTGFADLLDRTFTSTSVMENGEIRPLVLDVPITVTFSQDTVSAKAACNTLVGAASVADGVLTLDGQMAATMMACEQPAMDQDTWLAQFLASGPTVDFVNDTLTLATPTTVIAFTPLETVGMYDTPIHGPEALAAVEAMCADLVANKATVDEARATAENQGFLLRILVEDGEFGAATLDSNPGRLNLEVTSGVVTGCTAG